ncbi:MAG: hypothetical protein COB36_06845 [Alphaproteobacteria bacterium]|nr:MAG: hypothetical protein COB36_06845 [Alphaproteobacteria bacterium]
MRYVNKVLAALLVLAIGYLAYGLYDVRRDLFTVYDVPDHYAYDLGDADLTIVDFSRYGCDLCRLLHPVLMAAIKKDGKVRYVSRTLAYGNEWEATLATAVYAAGEQGKFIEMHDIINEKWPLNGRNELFKYARQIGLDTKLLSRDMSKKIILDQVIINQNYSDAWSLNRTPTILLGKTLMYVPRTKNVTVEDLLKKFKAARR